MTLTATLSPVLALGAALTGQAAPSPVSIRLAPPVDTPLLLQISDDRMVSADGTRATFIVTLHLLFERAAGEGWTVTMEQRGTACEGPEAVCTAFAAALGPRTGQRQMFAVNRNGVIIPAQMDPLPVDGRPGQPGANIAIVVAHREQSSPGAIVSAELTEALRFVASPASVLARTDDEGMIIVEDAAALAVTPNGDTIRRSNRAIIDGITGLVVESEAETRLSGGADGDRQLGVRRWTLRPLAAAPDKAPNG